jgi:predicted RNase H-like HicB family nuclease
MQHYTFTAQIERDNEAGVYTAYVPALPGAHTQAKSLDELNSNLKEVIELCLEEMTDEELANLPEFVGSQQIMIDR